MGGIWGNADCLKSKAELPIERWLGFFTGRKGKRDEKINKL